MGDTKSDASRHAFYFSLVSNAILRLFVCWQKLSFSHSFSDVSRLLGTRAFTSRRSFLALTAPLPPISVALPGPARSTATLAPGAAPAPPHRTPRHYDLVVDNVPRSCIAAAVAVAVAAGPRRRRALVPLAACRREQRAVGHCYQHAAALGGGGSGRNHDYCSCSDSRLRHHRQYRHGTPTAHGAAATGASLTAPFRGWRLDADCYGP
jgi:hypothetical protein